MLPDVCHMMAIDGDGRVLFYCLFLFCFPVFSFFLSSSRQANEFQATGQWRSSKRYQIERRETSGQVAQMPEIGWILGFLILRCAHCSLLSHGSPVSCELYYKCQLSLPFTQNLPTFIACPPRFLLCSFMAQPSSSHTHTHPSS